MLLEATRQLRKMSQTERYKRSQTDLGRYIIMLFCLQIYKNNPFFFLYHSEYSKFLSISLNATVFSKKKPQQKKTSCSLSTEILTVSGSSAWPHDYTKLTQLGIYFISIEPIWKTNSLFTLPELKTVNLPSPLLTI